MERMRRASGLSLEAHSSFNHDDTMQLQTSMEFTEGGSLEYKGFKINVGITPLTDRYHLMGKNLSVWSFAAKVRLWCALTRGCLWQDKGVQMSPEGTAPMSGITLSDLCFGEVLGKGSSATVKKVRTFLL